MRRRVRLQVRYSRRADLVLAASALAVILAGMTGGLVWSPGQAAASPAQVEQPRPLQYYLTRDSYSGDQVLSACTMGFHAAALWEILDTTNLRYNGRLGYTRRDSGYGPPAMGGWVRTGYASDATESAGIGNCLSWTSSSGSDYGSFVSLPGDWDAGFEDLMGWETGAHVCSDPRQVWCVGNESAVYLPLVLHSYSG
jgi:hypothetical protein